MQSLAKRLMRTESDFTHTHAHTDGLSSTRSAKRESEQSVCVSEASDSFLSDSDGQNYRALQDPFVLVAACAWVYKCVCMCVTRRTEIAF